MLTNRFHKTIQFHLKAESCIIMQKVNPFTQKKAGKRFENAKNELKMKEQALKLQKNVNKN